MLSLLKNFQYLIDYIHATVVAWISLSQTKLDNPSQNLSDLN